MKKFLTDRLGDSKGTEIYALIEKKLEDLRRNAGQKSKQQDNVLKNLILPRIAMYRVLQEQGYGQEYVMKLMEEHMIEYGAKPMRKKYEMMDKLPIAYGFFRFGFTHIVPSSDLWEADIDKSKKDEFSVTMHKCFWNDTYTEYGCPEICCFACQSDDITYSDLKHIEFYRTQTLGTGGNCCDFRFKKRK